MLSAPELVDGLNTGDRRVLAWLRRRVDQRARHRFSAAAWSQISEDFLADLTTQLLVTTGRGGFSLHGSVAAYVDVSIINLCKRYYLRVARARRNEPLPSSPNDELVADSHLVRIAQALEVEELLRSAAPDCRDLLVRKYLLGMTNADIAETAGVAAQTIQSRLHACRERVRAFYDQRKRGPRLLGE